MALTEYQKFVKKMAPKHKLRNGMVDLKTIGRLWRAKKGTSKSKPRTQTRSVSTVSSRAKPKAPSVRRKGKDERKRLAFKKEFDEIARGLGIALSKTKFRMIGNKWHLKIPPMKVVKRIKLSEAMKIVRKRARKYL